MVLLDWVKVVERFAERFESEFSTCSKKERALFIQKPFSIPFAHLKAHTSPSTGPL